MLPSDCLRDPTPALLCDFFCTPSARQSPGSQRSEELSPAPKMLNIALRLWEQPLALPLPAYHTLRFRNLAKGAADPEFPRLLTPACLQRWFPSRIPITVNREEANNIYLALPLSQAQLSVNDPSITCLFYDLRKWRHRRLAPKAPSQIQNGATFENQLLESPPSPSSRPSPPPSRPNPQQAKC